MKPRLARGGGLSSTSPEILAIKRTKYSLKSAYRKKL
jgi:hypothetical protein